MIKPNQSLKYIFLYKKEIRLDKIFDRNLCNKYTFSLSPLQKVKHYLIIFRSENKSVSLTQDSNDKLLLINYDKIKCGFQQPINGL